MTRFKKGSSGNPAGRPKGTKTAVNLLRDGLMGREDLAEIVAVLIEKAKAGDMQAATILLDRAVPRLKHAAVVGDETELAEAVSAAKIRGAKSEGASGMTLEALVIASSDPLRATTTTPASPADQSPYVERTESPPVAPAPVMRRPTPRPVRPITIPTPPADDDPFDIYNPT